MNDINTLEEAMKLANSMTTDEVAGTYFIEQIPQDCGTMIRIEITKHPEIDTEVCITVVRDCGEAGENRKPVPESWTPYLANNWLQMWLQNNGRCVDDFEAC